MEITLQQAVSDLRQAGALEIIRDVAREVYATNADRHDPAHGDDNGTFAQLVWRNIANLSFQKLSQAGIPVRKVAGGAIEVISGPWVVRIYKFPLTVPGKVRDKLEQLSWDGSAARLRGAVANSATKGQLAFDQDPDWADSFAEAVRQGHVRIVHTGDPETGNCVIEVGLPRDNREGGSPWLDGTAEIHNDLQLGLPAPRSAEDTAAAHGGLPPEALLDRDGALSEADLDEGLAPEGKTSKAPDYIDLEENELPLRRRTEETRDTRENTD
ncbi:hypothetical protein M8Z33_14655 [Streptomyces sp. ZAF1911]|uniref:hypothetical protein n=1 Tax=Streptomyces sp. ZAF1911 TaxID=2944129 RepID=UPI00237BA37D|nr:hypothetical protein [Streptomyces sp. ZAF1911]MDD9377879.1 hypothetical protein [Streptomyces sp. ZAF1911]